MPRFEDLLRELPRGSFYANSGYVLPFRDEPQEFLFEDDSAPNQVYGVFVDQRFFGTVTSDAAGAVIVRVLLDPGPHEIAIENDQTARRLRASVTVRDYAVWLASYAEALEGNNTFFGIDPALDSIERGPKLNEADSIHIEDVHGALLQQPNDLAYITDSYRTVLQGLRQAFRYFPSTPAGIAQVSASYTNSLALVLPRRLRPRWFLGSQFAPNSFLDQRTHDSLSQLPNLNIESLSAVSTLPATVASAASIVDPPLPQRLQVAFEAAWDGGNATVTGTDPFGTLITEVFTPIGTPVGGLITKIGTEIFSTVTNVTNSLVGTSGTAFVGLTASAFVQVVEVEGTPIREGLTSAGVTYLTLNNNAGELSLSYGPLITGNADNRVPIPLTGRYTIPYRARGARIVGPAAPVGGFDLSNGLSERGRDRLYLDLGQRGPLTVVLGAAAGSLVNNTPAQIATDIDNAFFTDIRYATGPGTVASSTTNLVGDAVQIDSDGTPFIGEALRSQVRVLLDCADAAREILGLPRQVGDATAGGTAGVTSISYTAGDSISVVSAPFTARVGRGLLASGVGTVSAAAGRFATFTSGAHNLRVGECVRLESTTGGNAGLHRVWDVVSPTVVQIRHESITGTFSNGGGQAYQAWALGDVVEVIDHDTGTQTLTLASPGLPRNLPAGYQIEVDGEVPYQTDADHLEAPSTLIVDVDRDLTPTVGLGASISDDLVLEGTLTPDGWLVNSGSNLIVKPDGLISDSGFGIERGALNIEFQTRIPRAVPDFLGFPFRVSFWVQQHNAATQDFRIDVSWDGATFIAGGTTTSVPGTLEADGTSRITRAQPTLVTDVVTPPHTATAFLVRLVHLGTAAGERVTVERAIVASEITSALFLGEGTIVRSDQIRNFGELVYIWSPNDLSADENRTIGIDGTGLPRPPTRTGKIDLIANAHGTIERFDVTEYAGNVPVNLQGAYDDVDWLSGTLTNMEVVVGVPGRLSYLRPTVLSRVEDEILNPDAFGVADLAETSTQLGPFPENSNGRFLLVENEIPIPDSADVNSIVPFVFTSATQIDIDNAEYSPGATYTATYDRLISAETATIDLTSNVSDYLWFVDAYIWRATAQTVGTRNATTNPVFLTDFTATIDPPSDQDQTNATLVEDTGITQIQVADVNWSFVDATTISINPSVFNETSIYSLEYVSTFNRFAQQPDLILQHRAASSPALLPGTAYVDIAIDAIVDNSLQFHQLRVQFFDITNLDDVRVHSLGLRGLNVFGTTPNAPGIILP